MGSTGLDQVALPKKVTIGIDPGIRGAVAVIRGGCLIGIYPLPQDGKELHALLARFSHKNTHIFVEKVQGRGGWAAQANFNFGAGMSRILTVIQILALPHSLVPPQTWQKVMFVGKNKKDTKACAKARFAELWPGWDWPAVSEDVKKGYRDAAMIAKYGDGL